MAYSINRNWRVALGITVLTAFQGACGGGSEKNEPTEPETVAVPEFVELEGFDFPVEACKDSRGLSVRYEELEPELFLDALQTSYIAAALDAKNRHPYIFYETEFFIKTGSAYQQLAFAHECAHHKFGDVVDRADNQTPFSVEQERQADCNGIEFLFNNRAFSQKDIDDVKYIFDQIEDFYRKEQPFLLASVEGRAEHAQICFDSLTR